MGYGSAVSSAVSSIGGAVGTALGQTKNIVSTAAGQVRDPLETAAVIAGNTVVPGSSIVTSNIASKGSQAQLSSPLGVVAQIGSSAYGVTNSPLPNSGTNAPIVDHSLGTAASTASNTAAGIDSAALGSTASTAATLGSSAVAATAGPSLMSQIASGLQTIGAGLALYSMATAKAPSGGGVSIPAPVAAPGIPQASQTPGVQGVLGALTGAQTGTYGGLTNGVDPNSLILNRNTLTGGSKSMLG